MSKLYVFGIGGTGSRVLKSLTMLLAAGVDMKGYEVVPIIIDPDKAAANLTQTVDLLRTYNEIRSKINFDNTTNNHFFSTKINLEINPKVIMPLENTGNVRFSEYIGLNGMKSDTIGKSNFALASMLFSQENLDADMAVGFKGNPNIGSVVLNQLYAQMENEQSLFSHVVSTLKDGDRIFVVSSIFGGTGASGFPLLIKNMRKNNPKLSNCNVLRNAPIGAISVLPYFGLQQNAESNIDSTSFISKAKAALEYYQDNLKEVNALYYVADQIKSQYKNVEGGARQKNKAHIVELISALSIVDFVRLNIKDLGVTGGVPNRNIYKEFGIENDATSVVFSDLAKQTNDIIRTPMSMFELFSKYIREQMDDNASQNQPWRKNLGVDKNFLSEDFYQNLFSFLTNNHEWLVELAENERAFAPFDLEVHKDALFSYVKGVKPAKVMRLDKDYGLYDSYLNADKKVSPNANIESRFVELFYVVTEKLVKDKLNMM